MIFKIHAVAIVLIALTASVSLEAATPVFKCTKNGSVTFQDDPCPTGEPRKAPTVEQLNAERQKRLREAPVDPSGSTVSAPGSQLPASPGNAGGSRASSERPKAAAAAPAGESFRCDGRVHCSQMTSCAEAQYFLGHCPGVKMDGDRNGIPCEKQWCNR